MKDYYSTFPPKISKEDAKHLLTIIRDDKEAVDDAQKRALIWARDHIGLTYKDISIHLLGKPYKQAAHEKYERLKGGDKS